MNKRLQKEFMELSQSSGESPVSAVRHLDRTETNLNEWTALLQLPAGPYSKGAFRFVLNFPAEYPFKPPKLTFKTKIYHPNVDEKGQVCLPIISPENWKPATKTEKVLGDLVKMIENPEPEHPLRADIAEEYTQNRNKFNKNAEEHTKKYAEKPVGQSK